MDSNERKKPVETDKPIKQIANTQYKSASIISKQYVA